MTWVKSKNALYTGEFEPEPEKAMISHVEQTKLHRRFGHPGRSRFKLLGKMIGITVNQEPESCELCIKAKKVKNQNHSPSPRAEEPLRRVFMDFWGLHKESIQGARYYLSLVDDHTRFSWTFPTKD